MPVSAFGTRRIGFDALEGLVHDMLARSHRVEYEEGDGTRPDFRLCDRREGAFGPQLRFGTMHKVGLFQQNRR